jgi:hypothetical protein
MQLHFTNNESKATSQQTTMSSTRRSSRNGEDVAVQEAEHQLFGTPIRAPPDNNPNNFGAVFGGLVGGGGDNGVPAADAAPPEDSPVQEMDEGAAAEAPVYIDPALANSYDEEDPAEEGLDAETRRTLRACLSPSTRSNYENSSVRLVLHLYDNESKYPHILKEWFINDLDQAVTEDENRVTTRGCPSRARTTSFKNAVLTAICAIVPENSDTLPLDLDLSILDFKAFSS